MSRFKFDPKRYPAAPGCYLMKDAAGEVLYVGKAKNLRRRLSSYYGSRRKGPRTRRLVARIGDIEVIIVSNEIEGLVLENNLIKRYKPRFNRKLVGDDTGYPYIVLTREEFPRFVPYRVGRVNKELEGVPGQVIERRFGPYVGTRFRDTLLEYVTDHFRIRTCRLMSKRACLRFHIDRCCGICEERVSVQEYADAVDAAVQFLSQQHTALIRQMKSQMLAHAERLEFERAQRIKEQVEALESTLETQIVERDVGYDQDVIVFGERKVLVTEVKRGAVQGLALFDLDLTQGCAEACQHFLFSRYMKNSPKELIVNRLSDPERVGKALTTANGHRVRVTLPKRGVKRELLQLCEKNYAHRVSDDELT